MKLKIYFLLTFFVSSIYLANSQEGLPIYTDYLTDNYYLIHPSMAGVANCAKVRLTTRQQWFGDDDAPKLTTLSVNGRIKDSQSALGGILYSDKNGYHSQNGAYLTYAHHLMFSRNEVDLNMLSFGLSAGVIQYKLDTSDFVNEPPDPLIFTQNDQRATEFNLDFGFSYHFLDFYAHFTIKNLLKNDGVNNDIVVTNNLRRYLASTGYVFHKPGSEWSFEPSVMFQYKDGTQESSFDLNAKAYKKMDFGKLWGGLSYRRSLDGAEFLEGTSVRSQKLQQITPILGMDYKDFVFAYTYTYQANSIVYSNTGFHQLTLGYNFNCRRERYDCECPAVN